MEKKKIIVIGIAILVLVLGVVLGISSSKRSKRSKEDKYRDFVAEQTLVEIGVINSTIEDQIDEKWITSEETEDGYKLQVERSQVIDLPETEFLKREILKDGDRATISYMDEEENLVREVEVNYYDAPKLAILIDDVGMSLKAIGSFSEIDEDITFATIPFLPKSRESTEKLKDVGFEVILHMPMAGSSNSLNSRTEGILLTTMGRGKVYDTFDRALEDVGNVDGFNNHMGSKFTSDEGKMRELLNYAKKKNLFFIDSNTAIKNMGYPISKEIGLPTYYCSHFLDNSREMEQMEKEIETAVKLAKQNGKALVIGHFHNGMAQAIKEKLGYIEDQGVKLVFVSELLEK